MTESTSAQTSKAKHRSGRRRLAPAALVAGVAASAALALSMTGTLAAFTASITNSNDTAATGTLVMQETNATGSVTCLSTDAGTNGNNINTNAATCSTINKYGGAGNVTMVPGGTPVVTTVKISNVGTVPANTFTLTPGACTPGTNTVAGNVAGSGDPCSKVNVSVTEQVGSGTATTVVASKSLTAFNTAGAVTLAKPIAPGTTVTYAFSVSLDSSAGNTFQGLSVSQPLTWSFTS